MSEAVSVKVQGAERNMSDNTGISVLDSSAAPDSIPDPKSRAYHVIVLTWNFAYLKSHMGILRVIQVLTSLAALLFMTLATPQYAGYLLLPLDWHLRTFVFVAVSGMLLSCLSLFVHCYRVVDSLRIDWPLLDVTLCGLIAFLYLFSASLVASAIDFYENINGNIPRSVLRQLVIGTILGYVCMALYGATAFLAYRRLRDHSIVIQFRRRRLSSTNTSSQPQTPTDPNSTHMQPVIA